MAGHAVVRRVLLLAFVALSAVVVYSPFRGHDVATESLAAAGLSGPFNAIEKSEDNVFDVAKQESANDMSEMSEHASEEAEEGKEQAQVVADEKGEEESAKELHALQNKDHPDLDKLNNAADFHEQYIADENKNEAREAYNRKKQKLKDQIEAASIAVVQNANRAHSQASSSFTAAQHKLLRKDLEDLNHLQQQSQQQAEDVSLKNSALRSHLSDNLLHIQEVDKRKTLVTRAALLSPPTLVDGELKPSPVLRGQLADLAKENKEAAQEVARAGHRKPQLKSKPVVIKGPILHSREPAYLADRKFQSEFRSENGDAEFKNTVV